MWSTSERRFIPTVKPALFAFQKQICTYLWRPDCPPTHRMTQCWVCMCVCACTSVCVCVWAERRESALVYLWWDEGKDWVVFEHLWTVPVLFISLLMACHSMALRLCWLDIRLYKSQVPFFYSRDRPKSPVHTSRNASLQQPIWLHTDSQHFPPLEDFCSRVNLTAVNANFGRKLGLNWSFAFTLDMLV